MKNSIIVLVDLVNSWRNICGKRIFTIVIGVAIIVGIFFLDSFGWFPGPLFFNVAMVVCSFLMCHEFYKALEEKGFKPIKVLGYLCTLLLLPVGVVQARTMAVILAGVVPVLIILGMLITVVTKLKYNIVDVAITLLGASYIVVISSFISSTRAMEMGVFLIFYIFCGAWFSDTFAFLIGIKWGKHKFSEISPKKSIEGCIAGVFGTLLFFLVYSYVLANSPSLEHFKTYEVLKNSLFTNYLLLVPLGIIVSVISQFGDFSASAIKRYVGIKDFSNLMPGHGGMLDRFDSVLFVAPIIYYTLYIIQFGL